MIWAECDGPDQIQPLRGILHRLVESQEQIATLAYVDTLEEQAVLEALLETSKPPWPAGSDRCHYLLRSPFRYPPLPWGSRFGARHEPGLLYGGLSQQTTLAESAYYRFVFRQSMTGPAPKDVLITQHTLFTAGYRTDQGLMLQAPPFDRFSALLMHPSDYAATQQLGAEMRGAGVQAFEYASARDPAHQPCVGLFTHQALAGVKPLTQAAWLCELREREVSFKPLAAQSVVSCSLDDFLVDGVLPRPA
ncbi:MAG: RES family NAD+ phosphorylase [Castellaniella sp.]|uniref:RES family NAD+ phosphorylase n=1 Tax=Castellaniella sp. TaxID=1955812 RepID=UPI003C773896